MISVTKNFRFEACHFLPSYVGACHNLHGHSYKLSVTVTGNVQKEGEKKGMIIDFKDLKRIVNEHIIGKYDHSYLNEHFENPTAEVMVEEFGRELHKHLQGKYTLLSVKLWETEDSYAEYTPEYENLLGYILQPATV